MPPKKKVEAPALDLEEDLVPEEDVEVEVVEPLPSVAVQPYTSPPPFLMRLREPMVYYKDGSRHVLVPGVPMSSQDYDYKVLIAQGAKLDMVDEEGTVLMDLTESFLSQQQ